MDDQLNEEVTNSKISLVPTSKDKDDVDKSFEGKGFMFRSSQAHTVYPFYTSDDYRISISGNIGFQ